ncbi:hypothetical protein FQN60_016807, partial [Etheostoma spectabile]
VRCVKEAVFVYSRLGGVALLPCVHQVSSDCSQISWTFYKGGQVRYTEEVRGGQVSPDSDKAGRMSVEPNCSLSLRGLTVEDAGSYVCLTHGKPIADVYLSLLTVTSVSSVTDLQPGGNLILSCVLFTYYDIGSCKSYSSAFNLSWVNAAGNSRAEFLDFTSTFLFQDPPTAKSLVPSPSVDCPVELPVSRILVCVALPVMVLIVGFFTWRADHKRAKTSAACIEL